MLDRLHHRRADLSARRSLRPLKRCFRLAWLRFYRLRGSPHHIALGFSLGVYVCWVPLFGFHTFLMLLLCWALRGNYIAGFMGTFVGNPLTFPFMWWASYSVGRVLMPGLASKHDPDFAIMGYLDMRNFIMELTDNLLDLVIIATPGGLVVGLVAMVPNYLLIRLIATRYRQARLARRRLRGHQYASKAL